MGGKSGTTIGYWFLDAIHYGLAQSMDALLKIAGDGNTAWSGRVTENTTISINAPDLYGGPQGSGEGGVVTGMDVLFGDADQPPNDYLAGVFGAPQTAHRGKASVVVKGGKTGAKSPYPKGLAFQVERILTDWPDDTPWYPEKAPIGIGPPDSGEFFTAIAVGPDGFKTTPDGSDWTRDVNVAGPGSISYLLPAGDRYVAWDSSLVSYTKDGVTFIPSGSTVGGVGGSREGAYFGGKILISGGISGLYVSLDKAASFTLLAYPDYPRANFVASTGSVVVVLSYYDTHFFHATDLEGPWIAGGEPPLASGGACATSDGSTMFFGGQADDASVCQVVATVDGDAISVESLPSFASATNVTCLQAGGGLLVAGTDSGEIAYKDGTGWHLADDVLGEAAVRAGWTGAYFVMWGSGGACKISSNGNDWTASAFGFAPAAVATGVTIDSRFYGLLGMNPAHMLYDSITLRPERGGQGEPVGLINDDSFTAAADQLFAEGFGLCTEWKGEETAEQFQQRILDIIAAAMTQSRINGQYYLDLIRDDYVFDDLPIFTETDILEFSQEPTNIDEAVNRIIVEWNDPVKDEDRATTPVTSLGAIQSAGGVVSETITHREIPYEDLALRVGARELRARATPLSRFNLTTNRRHHTLRKGQFFRLQKPSEGIADMVCLAAEVDNGLHDSGRMKFVATQAVFGMPDTVYVDPTPGLDTGSDPTPHAPAHQRVFEAPYRDLARRLSTADLAVLADESGYLSTVATRPVGNGINYSIHTAAAGESYADRGTGDWCPSAVIVEAAAIESPLPTAFTLSGGSDLGLVEVGNAALWDDEIVRVDAIDVVAGTITLARGCVDTVPAAHAAGARIWFYNDDAGSDAREYIDAEHVNAKLLTRTGSGELPLDDAFVLSLVMDSRQGRPYPTGQFTINGAQYPAYLFGELSIGGAWRDRVLQADQLIDTSAATVGPEAGTTATLRVYLDDVLDVETTGITSFPATYTPSGDGTVRVELETVRDGLVSWQRHVHSFDYTASEITLRITEAGDDRITESGAIRILE